MDVDEVVVVVLVVGVVDEGVVVAEAVDVVPVWEGLPALPLGDPDPDPDGIISPNWD